MCWTDADADEAAFHSATSVKKRTTSSVAGNVDQVLSVCYSRSQSTYMRLTYITVLQFSLLPVHCSRNGLVSSAIIFSLGHLLRVLHIKF